MKLVSTASNVIDILGGPAVLMRRLASFGIKVQPHTITQWRARGFPRWTYIVLNKILREEKLRAPDSLWNMQEPNGRRQSH